MRVQLAPGVGVEVRLCLKLLDGRLEGEFEALAHAVMAQAVVVEVDEAEHAAFPDDRRKVGRYVEALGLVILEREPRPDEIEIAKIAPKPFELVFAINSNSKPIVNFPIKFYSNKGELDLTKRSSTDISGNVSCIINRAVKRDAIQSFIAELDIMSFIQGATEDEEESAIFFGRLSNLGIPSKEVIVKVTLPVMSFNLSVINDLSKDKQTRSRFDTLVTAFKDGFAQETGVKFSENGAVLKLSITLDGTITQSSTSGQFFTKILVTVAIFDVKTGEELFTTTSPEIKGGSVTDIKSVQAAIEKYTKEYNKQLIKKVLNYMEGG